MSDSEKPFACTTAGCNMSFINEDHLTVHKKKHDMMLNLGINNKNNFFIADQTPTPTRFIRNCDEVGLFQDLQNENPFEETFRRAVESGKTGVSSLEVHENDDTLHTPNIFPHITEECTTSITTVSCQSKNQISKSEVKNFTESSTIVQTVLNKEISLEDVSKNNEESNKIIEDNILKDTEISTVFSKDTEISTVFSKDTEISTVFSKEDTIVQTEPVLSLDDNCSSKTETHVPINGAEVQLLLKTQDGRVLKFVAAPILETSESIVNIQPKEQSIAKTKVVINNNNKSDTKIIQTQKLSIARMKLKQTLMKHGTAIENKPVKNYENESNIMESSREKNSGSTDHLKKQSILERNRASSMRARAKRKAWIEQLQSSLKTANETNVNLQTQVKNLNAQVAKLKTLLLAHKDCPVTKAMEKGTGCVEIGSKVLTVKANEVKQKPVNSIKTKKRPNAEKIMIPKKKPVIISSIKSPIILPKTDLTANTITLHGMDTMKSVSTISIITPFTNPENGKTVLGFLHPDIGKVPLIQNSIPLNQTFDKNAASETTGT